MWWILEGESEACNRLIQNTVNDTIKSMIATAERFFMSHITANDLKTKGIAAIEAVLNEHTEAIVSVRGHARFVVMGLDQYHHLRECELENALAESRSDIAADRFTDESAEDHVARLLAAE